MRYLALLAALLLLFLPGPASAQTHHRLIVVLDPGHGGYGPDMSYTGAIDNGLEEKVLTLQVAKRAARDLRAMGYAVNLTRTRDQAVNWPPRDLNHDGTIDQLDDYNARTLFANRHHADIFVSIHFDAAEGAPFIHGTHGYYCPARPFWRQSKRLAATITAALAASLTHSGYSSPDAGVQTDVADKVPQRFPNYPWFFVLGPSWPKRITGSAMPGALIESLYLTSTSDATALKRSGTIAAIARGYAEGIRAYFHGHTMS
ncbi:MAG TPA: N-acetylmuramoyl-L-alanine amidase [Chloroflexota bacterium]|nr:N-acetylmuramoyl-L-alanine amidase [Chloroflexota bacterium]